MKISWAEEGITEELDQLIEAAFQLIKRLGLVEYYAHQFDLLTEEANKTDLFSGECGQQMRKNALNQIVRRRGVKLDLEE